MSKIEELKSAAIARKAEADKKGYEERRAALLCAIGNEAFAEIDDCDSDGSYFSIHFPGHAWIRVHFEMFQPSLGVDHYCVDGNATHFMDFASALIAAEKVHQRRIIGERQFRNMLISAGVVVGLMIAYSYLKDFFL